MRNCLSTKKVKFTPGEDANLRSMLLKLLPSTPTHWVFLKTLVISNLKDPPYWRNPKHYTNERAAQQLQVLAAQKASAESLAVRLSDCVAARGTSASGKTVWIRSHVGDSDVRGILSSDSTKAELKYTPSNPRQIVLNQQVHWEGTSQFTVVFDEIKQHATMKYVVDHL